MDNIEFSSLDQAPTVIWIGCSDARVPETQALPGTEIFVQRNVANQFSASDPNAAACVAFVLNLPSVKHIYVVGHTLCGGAQACLDTALGRPPGLHPALVRWLAPLQELANSFVKPDTHLNDLVRENVIRQVRNVREFLNTLPLGDRELVVSGAIYHIENNQLHVII